MYLSEIICLPIVAIIVIAAIRNSVAVRRQQRIDASRRDVFEETCHT